MMLVALTDQARSLVDRVATHQRPTSRRSCEGSGSPSARRCRTSSAGSSSRMPAVAESPCSRPRDERASRSARRALALPSQPPHARWVTGCAFDEPADLPVANPCPLTRLDVATCTMLGREVHRASLPRSVAPVAEVGDLLLLPALAGGRCFVSFSGGRESSAVLAATTRAARRHGHPDPVPVTVRYLRAESAKEIEVQEEVMTHLGLQEWERIVIDDELEITGPYARRTLETAGLLFPPNAYLMLPQLDVAAGGTLVVGFGVTDLFLYWHWARLWEAVQSHRRPGRADLRRLAAAALPPSWRGRLIERYVRRPRMSWLHAGVALEADRRFVAESLAAPVRFSAALERQSTHRCLRGTRRALAALAKSAGAQVVMPLYDDAFIGAVAAWGRWRGVGGRRHLLAALAGDLLPESVLRRGSGPPLQDVLFGERTRAFVDSWSGNGLDSELVDVEALHSHWSNGQVDWRSSLLLQAAFAHDAGVGKKDEMLDKHAAR
jgi:hypothetical protein